MKEREFWAIIETSNKQSIGDRKKQIIKIEEILSKLSIDDILDFHGYIDEKKRLCYGIRHQLWKISEKINGFTSDDGYDYFLGWLISQGESVFTAALKNPEIILEKTDPNKYGKNYFELEEIEYVSINLYEKKTGKDWYETVGM